MVGDASGYPLPPRPPLYCLRLPLTSYPLCFTPSPCFQCTLETPRMLLKVWETTERNPGGYDNVPTSSSHCSRLPSAQISRSLSPSPQPPERMSSPPFNPRLKPFLQQEHASHPWSLHQACPLWNAELGLQEVLSVTSLNEWMRPCFWVWRLNHTKVSCTYISVFWVVQLQSDGMFGTAQLWSKCTFGKTFL